MVYAVTGAAMCCPDETQVSEASYRTHSRFVCCTTEERRAHREHLLPFAITIPAAVGFFHDPSKAFCLVHTPCKLEGGNIAAV